MIFQIILYWILIEFKHVIADYVLQNSWIYTGKRRRFGYLAPLASHAAINAAGTLLVVLIFTGNMHSAMTAFAFDFVMHALIDRLKLVFERFMSAEAATVIDQMLHQATFVIIFIFWM